MEDALSVGLRQSQGELVDYFEYLCLGDRIILIRQEVAIEEVSAFAQFLYDPHGIFCVEISKAFYNVCMTGQALHNPALLIEEIVKVFSAIDWIFLESKLLPGLSVRSLVYYTVAAIT